MDVLPVWRGACRTEYFHCPNEPKHVIDVDPIKRRDVVVARRYDRPRRVEEAHCRIVARGRPAPRRKTRPPTAARTVSRATIIHPDGRRTRPAAAEPPWWRGQRARPRLQRIGSPPGPAPTPGHHSGKPNTNRLFPWLGLSSGVRLTNRGVPVLTATYCRPSTA